jgi:hypothetical protein
MANKRDLKKSINCICNDLFTECVAAQLYSGKPGDENVSAVLASIAHLQNNYVNRISHPEPGMKPKVYFKDLIEHFNKEAGEIIDHIINLH